MIFSKNWLSKAIFLTSLMALGTHRPTECGLIGNIRTALIFWSTFQKMSPAKQATLSGSAVAAGVGVPIGFIFGKNAGLILSAGAGSAVWTTIYTLSKMKEGFTEAQIAREKIADDAKKDRNKKHTEATEQLGQLKTGQQELGEQVGEAVSSSQAASENALEAKNAATLAKEATEQTKHRVGELSSELNTLKDEWKEHLAQELETFKSEMNKQFNTVNEKLTHMHQVATEVNQKLHEKLEHVERTTELTSSTVANLQSMLASKLQTFELAFKQQESMLHEFKTAMASNSSSVDKNTEQVKALETTIQKHRTELLEAIERAKLEAGKAGNEDLVAQFEQLSTRVQAVENEQIGLGKKMDDMLSLMRSLVQPPKLQSCSSSDDEDYHDDNSQASSVVPSKQKRAGPQNTNSRTMLITCPEAHRHQSASCLSMMSCSSSVSSGASQVFSDESAPPCSTSTPLALQHLQRSPVMQKLRITNRRQ